MPSVLLTGGRGFFGRRIAEALAARGYEVATPGRPEFDLLDRSSIECALQQIRPAIVVHSAAYYGGLGICVAEPAKIFHDNVLMAAHLIDASGKAGVERFVSIGSACGYAAHVAGDMKEEDYWSGPLHPSVEAYGFMKKIHEVGLRAYEKQFGWQWQQPIITNLYGEHDVFTEYRSHVVAALIKRFADAVQSGATEVVCWGTGTPVREFVYVADAAEATARLLDTDYCGRPVNVGTGVGTTIRQLAEVVARLTGFTGRIVWDSTKPDGVARKVLDVTTMKQVLGWAPLHSLEDGLAKTIEWYLANKTTADARR